MSGHLVGARRAKQNLIRVERMAQMAYLLSVKFRTRNVEPGLVDGLENRLRDINENIGVCNRIGVERDRIGVGS